ncbi:Hypothetical protein NocV09_01400440 [Nannochloropsis oceanica]
MKHEEEEEEEEDVPLEVRAHVGEIGRHYKALSKRHIFCLTLLAAASIWLENDDWGLLLKKACLALFISSFADYLIRPSPLLDDVTVRLQNHDIIRPYCDKLVWSSYVYGLAGLYSLYLGQYAFGTLQLVTCCGSTLYHLRKEAVFFNFDNTFASSLLLLTLYAGGLSIHVQDWAHLVATILGLPIAVFLIIFCGMPASLAREPGHGTGARGAVGSGTGCLPCSEAARSGPDLGRPGFRLCAGAQYDDWHTAWHVVSGAGTVVTASFFQHHWPGLQCGGPNFGGGFPHLPVVPTACVVLALGMNMVGNMAGIMPVC